MKERFSTIYHKSVALFPPPASGYRCVCMTGTAQSKAEVQSKSRRKRLFSDMSWAHFAAVEADTESAKRFHCT